MPDDVEARPTTAGVPLAEAVPDPEGDGEAVPEAMPVPVAGRAGDSVVERLPGLRLPSAIPEPQPTTTVPPPSDGLGSDTHVSLSLDGMIDPRRVDVDADHAAFDLRQPPPDHSEMERSTNGARMDARVVRAQPRRVVLIGGCDDPRP